MRAKFIYEKFTEEGDPIHNLGIGYPAIIELFKEKLEQFEKKIKPHLIGYEKQGFIHFIDFIKENKSDIKRCLNISISIMDSWKKELKITHYSINYKIQLKHTIKGAQLVLSFLEKFYKEYIK
jgi:hypothetical protein